MPGTRRGAVIIEVLGKREEEEASERNSGFFSREIERESETTKIKISYLFPPVGIGRAQPEARSERDGGSTGGGPPWKVFFF